MQFCVSFPRQEKWLCLVEAPVGVQVALRPDNKDLRMAIVRNRPAREDLDQGEAAAVG